jgi:cell fate regulator YaaT (PSP1 superfamily)
MQILKNRIDLSRYEVRKVYRIAKDADIERADEAHAKEQETMIKARKIAKDMQLDMKIGDVEYQGDGTKAIFYYIADDRVDFRQLIKVFAETFRVRIEMKQIGARQEAGRIGGTGPCGRELCCTTWLTNFTSVTTTAARVQDLSLNPQKLAGQCAKLKCCLNFELDDYQDALRHFPDRNTTLETMEGTWYHFKSNPLAGEVTYSSDPKIAANLVVITAQQANDIIEMNRKGQKPNTIGGKHTSAEQVVKTFDYENVVGQDELTRFDRPRQQRRQQQPRSGNQRRVGGNAKFHRNNNPDKNENSNNK